MRLIDADALKKKLSAAPRNIPTNVVIDLITNAPTVQREGWVSVPIEPTDEMLDAVLKGTPYVDDNKQLMREAYKAMIQAAPTDTE